MSLHVFANFVTPFGTAANNRGDSEGSNITPLQKLIWQGQSHTTVSAEAIRFALRRRLEAVEPTNRTWNESALPKPRNEWKDDQFSGWSSPDADVYIDDDLLGFMSAQAANEDGSDVEVQGEKPSKRVKAKGTVTLRRGLLEVTRAVSITPWSGDVSFNANTPWSNLGAKDKNNPGPYGTELHATRYQFGIALTPERLRDKSRAAKAIEAICNLGTVAGNHGRFLFDFSPDAVVLRITQDPAPRLLYCFETADNGKTATAESLVQRIRAGDIDAAELILGVSDLDSPLAKQLAEVKVKAQGVKAACAAAVAKINAELKVKG